MARRESLPLHSPNWIPLAEAHRLLCGLTGDRDLAAKDLTAKAREGLPTMRRYVGRAPGFPDRELVPTEYWLEHWLGPSGIVFEGFRSYVAVRGYAFFVWKPALAKIWPTVFAPTTPTSKQRRKGSREQGLITEVAAEMWPGGYKHVRTGEIIKRAGDELEKRGLPVPKRDVFLRALGRRKG